MPETATPNLPARDFDETEIFFASLGFQRTWRDSLWMVMKRESVVLEFFRHTDLNPTESWFSCCIHTDNLSEWMAVIEAAGVPDTREGFPRIHPPRKEDGGLEIAYLTDPSGSLIRLIAND